MIAIMSRTFIDQLSALAKREKRLAAGDVLFRADDPVLSLFVVKEGALRLTRSLPHGGQVTLQRAGTESVLAEASLFASHYHCEGVAIEPSVVRVVPKQRVEASMAQDLAFARAWGRHLAQQLQRTRALAEILSLKTVAERLDAWLALEAAALPPKGIWRQVAAEIGVSPEALYREIARRRSAL